MPEITFRVNAVTTGGPSRKFEAYRVNYVYGGTRKDTPAPPSQATGGQVLASRRNARIGRFGEALKTLGATPETAGLADILEAGRRVGVGDRTAKGYRTALVRQRQEEGTP